MGRPCRLTCNQMICLLAAYRGTLEVDEGVGTRRDDLAHLRANGLLDGAHRVTEKGEWRVKKALKGPRRGYGYAPVRYRIGD